VLRHHWLFDQRVELAYPDPRDDLQAHAQAVEVARLEGIREVVSETGAEGVFRLLTLAPDASTVGWAIGEERLLRWEEAGLPAILDSTDKQHLQFVHSYISSRYRHEGWDFVNTIPITEWAPNQVATFARCLPFNGEVWQWLRQFGPTADSDYWEGVRGYLRQPDLEQTKTACHSLIGVGRPFTAVDVLHMSASLKVSIPNDLIAEVLEAAFTVRSSSNDLGVMRSVQYPVQQLIKTLQQAKEFDRARLARIEWGLLQFLDKDSSDVGPDTLVRGLESNPEFFVDLLTLAYRGENEPPRESPLPEQELLRARSLACFWRVCLDFLEFLITTT
jgi:hypothetical protein